jgi:hypothetical protein
VLPTRVFTIKYDRKKQRSKKEKKLTGIQETDYSRFTIPIIAMTNATISMIFRRVTVFDSLVSRTKRRRIRTPQIPAPKTIKVLFISFAPYSMKPSDSI